MKLIKKAAITVFGIGLLLIGILFIILPGPAILIIPLALALLATEYPVAKVWLKKFQVQMKRTAHWLDSKWRTWKYRN